MVVLQCSVHVNCSVKVKGHNVKIKCSVHIKCSVKEKCSVDKVKCLNSNAVLLRYSAVLR